MWNEIPDGYFTNCGAKSQNKQSRDTILLRPEVRHYVLLDVNEIQKFGHSGKPFYGLGTMEKSWERSQTTAKRTFKYLIVFSNLFTLYTDQTLRLA